jgi:DNA polymerase/3'-5' exonuclease PolX
MSSGKMDLGIAAPLADRIVQHVSSAMERVSVAGSIRRQKSVVGDIEVVGIPGDRERLISLLRDIGMHIKPGVPGEVPWEPKVDAKYMRVRLNEGINLDLFLATPDNWGCLYMMRTGSGAGPDGNAFNGFVPGVFGRWKKVSGGGRMVGCLPTTPDGVSLPVAEEQDLFDLVGMDFVPPEERVTKGAIKKYAYV